jgi:hypothetical protein
MAESKIYVQSDEQGARRIGRTRVSLDSVVIAYQQATRRKPSGSWTNSGDY